MNTKYCKVTAIFSSLDLEKVEDALKAIDVSGLTVSKARGFGEYRNYYAEDTMADWVRAEIFEEAVLADRIVETIARTVHKGLDSDGFVAVLPVEYLLHIRDFKDVQ